VFEVLEVTPALRSLIARRAPTAVLRDAARAAGFTSLGEDARRLLGVGRTTECEVQPLLQQMAAECDLCAHCGAPVRDGFRACPLCGTTLSRRCACGARVEPGWQFCSICAVALANSEVRGVGPHIEGAVQGGGEG
jgi:hypothetical protein